MSDLDLDKLPRFGVERAARRHQHFLLDFRVVRNDKTDVALNVVATNDAFVSPTDHFNDRALTTPTPIKPGNARQTAVAVEHQAHLRGAEKQVIAAVIRDEKAEAVAVPTDATADQVQLVHRGIGAAPGVD